MQPIGGFDGASFGAAQRAHQQNHTGLVRSMERLATGSRINRAADDPAGLITSENLRAVLAALDAETRVLERADHVAATADGALSEVSDLLVQAEAKVVANANSAGLSDEERAANQLEIDSILSTVNRISGTTTFNGQSLLDGTATLTADGASVEIESVAVGPIGEGADAQTALADARSRVATTRGSLGAFSRYTVGSALERIGVEMENVAAAESAIRDTDYGMEVANLARHRLLNDASLMAINATGNAQARVLSLLG